MTKGLTENFNPTVRCPRCRGFNRPSISGWGREGVNGRRHMCKHCKQEYTVVCYVETDIDYKISDGHLSALKSRIEIGKKVIRDLEAKRVNENRELAKEIIRLEASSRGNQN